MKTNQQSKTGRALRVAKYEIESIDLGARAALALGALVFPEVMEKQAATRRGEGAAAGAAASWARSVVNVDSDGNPCNVHGAARVAPGPVLSTGGADALPDVERAALLVESVAMLGMRGRLAAAARRSSCPGRWFRAARRIAARDGERVRAAAAEGADVVGLLSVLRWDFSAFLGACEADARAARLERFQRLLSNRGAGWFHRRAIARGSVRAARVEWGDECARRAREVEKRADARTRDAGHPARRAIIEREAAARTAGGPAPTVNERPGRDDGQRIADALAAGIYRRAARIAAGSSSNWVDRNCAKFARPARDPLAVDGGESLRLRRSAWSEHSDGGGDDVRAAECAAEEILGEYRQVWLSVVPLFVRFFRSPLFRGRGNWDGPLSPRLRQDQAARGWSSNPRAEFVEALKRRLWKSSAAAAGRILHAENGRGGKVWSLTPWSKGDGVPLSDAGAEVEARRMAAADALRDALGEEIPQAPRKVASSEPRAMASGGSGKRSTVELKLWKAARRVQQEVNARRAKAAKGGKGSGPVLKGAAELSATLAHVRAALSGGMIPDAVAVELVTGPEGGVANAWEIRARKFRAAAGLKAAKAPRKLPAKCDSVRWQGWQLGAAEDGEGGPVRADWEAFDSAMADAAARPLAIVRA